MSPPIDMCGSTLPTLFIIVQIRIQCRTRVSVDRLRDHQELGIEKSLFPPDNARAITPGVAPEVERLVKEVQQILQEEAGASLAYHMILVTL
jgi:hypothetical protein